jgi:hypothetical protein
MNDNPMPLLIVPGKKPGTSTKTNKGMLKQSQNGNKAAFFELFTSKLQLSTRADLPQYQCFFRLIWQSTIIFSA